MYDTKREYETDEALLEAEHDNMAVDEFAKAMKEKLAIARAKGRSGWNDKEACSDEDLSYLFYHHLPKFNEGNFVDLANFLMFLHVRGANPNVLSDAIVSLLTSTIKESERRGKEIKAKDDHIVELNKKLEKKYDEILRLKVKLTLCDKAYEKEKEMLENVNSIASKVYETRTIL